MTIINTKKKRDQRRVQMTDNPADAILAVSENLIGNVTWLTVLMSENEPPKNMLGFAMGHLVSIDDMGIYGEHLWDLFKHVLDCDVRRFSAMSQALQAGQVTANEIREAARNPRDESLKASLNSKIDEATADTSNIAMPML